MPICLLIGYLISYCSISNVRSQGEGAPTLRKGTCANHIRDIAKLLTGAHLTIAARTEDDVESERIMEKISAVGSAYSFKENRNRNDDGK